MSSVIIDVREPDEFKQGHVKGAINIPVTTMDGNSQLKTISKDAQIIVYCRSGARSQMAEHYLKSHGYTNVTNGVNQDRVQQTFS